MKSRRLKVLCWSAVIFGACCGLLVMVANIVILHQASRVYDNLTEVPYHRVGLLLGSATRRPNGTENFQTSFRVQCAVRLFQLGKISHILVSGDNHVAGYDEPSDIRAELMALGVPASRITLDYAGFHTMDSVVRAQAIFGQHDLTIISQRYHDYRALALAQHVGIDAVAVAAQDVPVRRAVLTHLREIVSRTFAFLECTILPCRPHFLGQAEPIAVDQDQAGS